MRRSITSVAVTSRTVIAIGLVGLFMGLGAAPAMAATFTSSMNQVQPTFQSRTWSDTTAGTTTVTLTSCKGNYGGNAPTAAFVHTVRIALYRNGSLVSQVTRNPCGAFTFTGQSAGSFYFRVAAINGITTPTTNAYSGTFLNAGVTTSY